ncbi:glycosyltransferase family 2 protein [Acidihalobacter ferrooxydans]|uniref:glycosyltransferase family 2 protein n=1 Tax=Acidihalobacter ferrooxydans TaxID=1765967 RepID=UPI00214FDD1C|nr:glycosyltransferase family 2 protein [Acidihalobacter ferrooxydans]
MTGQQNKGHRLSVVVPMYNEADNVLPLLERVHEGLRGYAGHWEVILVDDGSSDHTARRLHAEAARFGPHVRVVELMRNFGQTAAMQAGLDAARGDVIATLDGDLQNDPSDIPAMIERLYADDLDLVAGWRRNRQDALLMRKIPSRIANRLIARTTGVHLHDYGCSLKVYRAQVIKGVRLYGEMHRFIPAWMAMATSPRRIGEMVVNHNARLHGESKYGISRTFRVVLDLLTVAFFMRYRARPLHFFGSIGLVSGGIGSLILLYLLVVKFAYDEPIGTRPLLLVGVVLVIAALQFLTTGVLAELMTRTYFESTRRPPYLVREADAPPPDVDSGWFAAEVAA